MNGKQFDQALARLGWTQRGAARKGFHVNERTVRDWKAQGPPNPVALCLSLMLEFGISGEQAEIIAARIFK